MSKNQAELEVVDSKSPVGSETDPKHRGNIVLVPQPSDDPNDPLVSPCILIIAED